MNIVAIIQARMGSTRLPGKVLKSLPYDSGIPAILHVVNRAKKSKNINRVIIATSDLEKDDVLENFCLENNISCFRGSEADVLSRFYFAAKKQEADYIVRLTGDCPCIDPEVIDYVINDHFENKSDFSSAGLIRTFPYGIDISIFSFALLEEAFNEAKEDYQREHVTPYFYKGNKNFNVNIVKAPAFWANNKIRITLDTIEDYTLLCQVFDFLYEDNPFFTLKEIITLFNEKPWLLNINNQIIQKRVFENLNEELEEISNYAKEQDLTRAFEWLNEITND